MASFTSDRDDVLNMIVTSTASVSRKRKREDERSVLGDSFVIKPHSSSVFDSLVRLTPAVVLPRSYIPLQWLAGYPSRLLSTPVNLPALDIPGNVIIVKVEGERQLAAVEKVKDSVYTLYKLSTQLKMKDVRKTFAQVKKSRQNSESLHGGVNFTPEILGSEWWSGLATPGPGFPVGGLCTSESTIKLIMGSSDLDNYDDRPPSPPPPVNAPLSPPAAAGAACEKLEIFTEPTLADILEKTRVQYFKTLYIAKTSLAYFAKSTLSRARVAMQQEKMLPSPPDSSSKLRDFLLEMHLPFGQMDIKYRKSIPQIVMEDQVEDTVVFKPGEEEYVQQWRLATWQERLVQANDPTLKRKVEELKIRETELQIIVLLEVLALEREQATSTRMVTNGAQPSLKKKFKSESKKGKRKSRTGTPDPKLLLDLLIDRLCIWRSIGSGGSDGLEEDSSDQKKVTDREHDHLRHFCVEVVLAFYASRLPDECASINKKCGGSNTRRGVNSPSQAKTKGKRSAKRPSLLRSITAPAATSVTREASVDTLAALVAADARGTVRGGTLNSKSFAKREVQISSRNGQKKLDEELKEAIDALKKPNRVAAASEMVDESAKRLSKRPKKPARNPLAKVQVMATPKRRRTIPPTHQPISSVPEDMNDLNSHDPFYVPRITGPRTGRDIPGTPLRRDSPTQDFDTIPPTSPFEPIEDRRPPIFRPTPGSFVTPQKRPRRSDLGSGNFVLSSATKIQGTLPRFPQLIAPSEVSKFMAQDIFDPVGGDFSPAGGVRLFDNAAVGETPPKTAVVFAVPKMYMGEKKEISIYDSLGWDDDYDL